MTHVTELWQSRELLFYWMQREISVRYKQSVLGVVWAILQPIAMAIVFTLVFSRLARLPSDGIPYPIFVYSALVPWTFFATSIGQGIPSVVGQMNLVTKSKFPHEIIPLGSITAAFVDYLCAFAIFIVMMLFYRVPISAEMLWWPLILTIQTVLIVGVVLLGATLNVFFRDIRFAIPLGLQIWMYATPIIYPLSMVPERWRLVYGLNPMVGIIESYRNIFIRGLPPTWDLLAVGAVTAFVLFLSGYALFKRLEPAFADII